MEFSDLIAEAQTRLSADRLYVDDNTDADVRIIAAFLDLFDTTSPEGRSDTAFLDELRARRARASLTAGSREAGRAAAAEVTTVDDIHRLNDMARARGPLIIHLADTHTSVWADFRTGLRCCVCAMTPAQAKAADYNCTEEC